MACIFTPVGYEAGKDFLGGKAAAFTATLTLSRKLAVVSLRCTVGSPVYWALASVDVLPR